MLETIIHQPDNKPLIGSVIWLHGLGADGHDFEPIVSDLQPFHDKGLRFILPHAPLRPVTLFNGMPARAWFDLFIRQGEYGLVEDDIKAMRTDIQELIEREIDTQGLSSEQIIVAGFSQGGAMAVYTALHVPQPLGGLIGLSTFLPDIADTVTPIRLKPCPAFIGHGTQDEVVPLAAGLALSHRLSHQGHPLTWKTYPMPHTVSQETVQDIRQWLGQCLKGFT